MSKIRLTQRQLNNIIKESVSVILNEANNNKKEDLDKLYDDMHQSTLDFGDGIGYHAEDDRSEVQKQRDTILQSLISMRNDINAMIRMTKGNKENTRNLIDNFINKCQRYINTLKEL